MKRSLVISFIAVTCLAVVALGQRRPDNEDKETIRRTLDFSGGNGEKVFEVDNVNGRIRVTGYDGRSIEMIANKTIHARSQDYLELARKEVSLDVKELGNTINVFVDQPGHERSTLNSSSNNWRNRGYEVVFDFDIRVPRSAVIHLWNVNGGPVEVEDMANDFSVSNVNGGIEMRNIAGSGLARTVNGQVKVAFVSSPKNDSEFRTVNGGIDVTFPRDLSADLRFKTMHGGVYTDFPVTPLPITPVAGQGRDGRFVYKNDFSAVRIGRGGPTLEFEGLNTNIEIRQAK